jgi:hypothetical protein
MPSLQKQILDLFSDVDPGIREVVKRVLEVEQSLIHLEKPHGVMEQIDQILETVAKQGEWKEFERDED